MNLRDLADFLQRTDAPYAVGAFSPRDFIRQALSLVLLRSTIAPPGSPNVRGLTFSTEADFWENRDLLSPVTLDCFWISDWFPRAPGLYWSKEAMEARARVERTTQKRHDSLGY